MKMTCMQSAEQQELEHLTYAEEVLYTKKDQVLGPELDGGYSVRKKNPTLGIKKADFPESMAIQFLPKTCNLMKSGFIFHC